MKVYHALEAHGTSYCCSAHGFSSEWTRQRPSPRRTLRRHAKCHRYCQNQSFSVLRKWRHRGEGQLHPTLPRPDVRPPVQELPLPDTWHWRILLRAQDTAQGMRHLAGKPDSMTSSIYKARMGQIDKRFKQLNLSIN
ncbi:hypothetical protein TNIN_279771 [Trichonephila inaurata madagascariensis]|uniref:Uncharacterized protein n=1 Tax=Trichonephila inaurata madagascariensis TaxID=2747483 RepID=A0A8X6Y5P1_9ARAC|nr:hypothetical protein TNIN_279771 [Trichonephila inaurata madagascariensis]